eukprot:gene11985-14159_t
MGLLLTLEQNFEDIQDGEKVAQDISEHIYSDGGMKVGYAIHILKMRSMKGVKAVYYIFQDEEYCRQHNCTVDLSFREHYLLDNDRKFNALRWVGQLEVATIHREPLSLFTQLMHEEPEVQSNIPALLEELEERAEIAEEKVEMLEEMRDGYMETLQKRLDVADLKAKDLEEMMAIKVGARDETLRTTIEEKCALEKRNALMENDLSRDRKNALEKHYLRLSLEEQLKAALEKTDKLSEENTKLRGQQQQVEESSICFTYPELEDNADDCPRSFPAQDVRKQQAGLQAPAASRKKAQPRSVVVNTGRRNKDFQKSQRNAAPGGSDQ